MTESIYSPGAAASKLWNPYTQTMPRKQLDALHLRKVQLLLKYAYERTSFYRQLYDRAGFKPEDIRTWDDFHHKVPLTDKPDLVREQQSHPFAVAALPQEYFFHQFQTGGTTGSSIKEVYSLFDVVRFGEEHCFGLWNCGLRAGDGIFFCFHWGVWVGLWTLYWTARKMGLIVLSGGGMSTQERIKQIISLKPTSVVGTPTYLLHMMHVAQEIGLDMREAGVKFLIGGGEPGFSIPATRELVQEGWGGPTLIDAYGMSEVGVVNCECGAHPLGVHCSEDGSHSFSLGTETGERVGEGEVGENIITSYNRATQPFIKYRTHDLVERHEEFDHGCGWTWAFLAGGVLGRTDYMVVIRGVNVYPTAVESLLSKIDGASAYYELHITREEGMDRMTVKVEAKDGVPAERYAGIAASGERVYASSIGVKLGVEVVPPKALPRYEIKTKRLFDHRPPEIRRKLER